MTRLSSSIPDPHSYAQRAEKFYKTLTDLSKPGLFKKFIVIESDGILKSTHFLRVFWENVKKVFGFRNGADEYFVEFKVLEFLLDGLKYIPADSQEFELIKIVAERAGLTSLKSSKEKSLKEVNSLMARISSLLFLKKEQGDISEQEANQLLVDFYLHYQKKLKPFSEEISKKVLHVAQEVFNQKVHVFDRSPSSSTDKEEDKGQKNEADNRHPSDTLFQEDPEREPFKQELTSDLPIPGNGAFGTSVLQNSEYLPYAQPEVNAETTEREEVGDRKERSVKEFVDQTLPSALRTTAKKAVVVASAIMGTLGYGISQYFWGSVPFSDVSGASDPSVNDTHTVNAVVEGIAEIVVPAAENFSHHAAEHFKGGSFSETYGHVVNLTREFLFPPSESNFYVYDAPYLPPHAGNSNFDTATPSSYSENLGADNDSPSLASHFLSVALDTAKYCLQQHPYWTGMAAVAVLGTGGYFWAKNKKKQSEQKGLEEQKSTDLPIKKIDANNTKESNANKIEGTSKGAKKSDDVPTANSKVSGEEKSDITLVVEDVKTISEMSLEEEIEGRIHAIMQEHESLTEPLKGYSKSFFSEYSERLLSLDPLSHQKLDWLYHEHLERIKSSFSNQLGQDESERLLAEFSLFHHKSLIIKTSNAFLEQLALGLGYRVAETADPRATSGIFLDYGREFWRKNLPSLANGGLYDYPEDLDRGKLLYMILKLNQVLRDEKLMGAVPFEEVQNALSILEYHNRFYVERKLPLSLDEKKENYDAILSLAPNLLGEGSEFSSYQKILFLEATNYQLHLLKNYLTHIRDNDAAFPYWSQLIINLESLKARALNKDDGPSVSNHSYLNRIHIYKNLEPFCSEMQKHLNLSEGLYLFERPLAPKKIQDKVKDVLTLYFPKTNGVLDEEIINSYCEQFEKFRNNREGWETTKVVTTLFYLEERTRERTPNKFYDYTFLNRLRIYQDKYLKHRLETVNLTQWPSLTQDFFNQDKFSSIHKIALLEMIASLEYKPVRIKIIDDLIKKINSANEESMHAFLEEVFISFKHLVPERVQKDILTLNSLKEGFDCIVEEDFPVFANLSKQSIQNFQKGVNNFRKKIEMMKPLISGDNAGLVKASRLCRLLGQIYPTIQFDVDEYETKLLDYADLLQYPDIFQENPLEFMAYRDTTIPFVEELIGVMKFFQNKLKELISVGSSLDLEVKQDLETLKERKEKFLEMESRALDALFAFVVLSLKNLPKEKSQQIQSGTLHIFEWSSSDSTPFSEKVSESDFADYRAFLERGVDNPSKVKETLLRLHWELKTLQRKVQEARFYQINGYAFYLFQRVFDDVVRDIQTLPNKDDLKHVVQLIKSELGKQESAIWGNHNSFNLESIHSLKEKFSDILNLKGDANFNEVFDRIQKGLEKLAELPCDLEELRNALVALDHYKNVYFDQQLQSLEPDALEIIEKLKAFIPENLFFSADHKMLVLHLISNHREKFEKYLEAAEDEKLSKGSLEAHYQTEKKAFDAVSGMSDFHGWMCCLSGAKFPVNPFVDCVDEAFNQEGENIIDPQGAVLVPLLSPKEQELVNDGFRFKPYGMLTKTEWEPINDFQTTWRGSVAVKQSDESYRCYDQEHVLDFSSFELIDKESVLKFIREYCAPKEHTGRLSKKTLHLDRGLQEAPEYIREVLLDDSDSVDDAAFWKKFDERASSTIEAPQDEEFQELLGRASSKYAELQGIAQGLLDSINGLMQEAYGCSPSEEIVNNQAFDAQQLDFSILNQSLSEDEVQPILSGTRQIFQWSLSDSTPFYSKYLEEDFKGYFSFLNGEDYDSSKVKMTLSKVDSELKNLQKKVKEARISQIDGYVPSQFSEACMNVFNASNNSKKNNKVGLQEAVNLIAADSMIEKLPKRFNLESLNEIKNDWSTQLNLNNNPDLKEALGEAFDCIRKELENLIELPCDLDKLRNAIIALEYHKEIYFDQQVIVLKPEAFKLVEKVKTLIGDKLFFSADHKMLVLNLVTNCRKTFEQYIEAALNEMLGQEGLESFYNANKNELNEIKGMHNFHEWICYLSGAKLPVKAFVDYLKWAFNQQTENIVDLQDMVLIPLLSPEEQELVNSGFRFKPYGMQTKTQWGPINDSETIWKCMVAVKQKDGTYHHYEREHLLDFSKFELDGNKKELVLKFISNYCVSGDPESGFKEQISQLDSGLEEAPEYIREVLFGDRNSVDYAPFWKKLDRYKDNLPAEAFQDKEFQELLAIASNKYAELEGIAQGFLDSINDLMREAYGRSPSENVKKTNPIKDIPATSAGFLLENIGSGLEKSAFPEKIDTNDSSEITLNFTNEMNPRKDKDRKKKQLQLESEEALQLEREVLATQLNDFDFDLSFVLNNKDLSGDKLQHIREGIRHLFQWCSSGALISLIQEKAIKNFADYFLFLKGEVYDPSKVKNILCAFDSVLTILKGRTRDAGLTQIQGYTLSQFEKAYWNAFKEIRRVGNEQPSVVEQIFGFINQSFTKDHGILDMFPCNVDSVSTIKEALNSHLKLQDNADFNEFFERIQSELELLVELPCSAEELRNAIIASNYYKEIYFDQQLEHLEKEDLEMIERLKAVIGENHFFSAKHKMLVLDLISNHREKFEKYLEAAKEEKTTNGSLENYYQMEKEAFDQITGMSNFHGWMCYLTGAAFPIEPFVDSLALAFSRDKNVFDSKRKLRKNTFDHKQKLRDYDCDLNVSKISASFSSSEKQTLLLEGFRGTSYGILTKTEWQRRDKYRTTWRGNVAIKHKDGSYRLYAREHLLDFSNMQLDMNGTGLSLRFIREYCAPKKPKSGFAEKSPHLDRGLEEAPKYIRKVLFDDSNSVDDTPFWEKFDAYKHDLSAQKALEDEKFQELLSIASSKYAELQGIAQGLLDSINGLMREAYGLFPNPEEENAATRIQNVWRDYLAREKVEKAKQENPFEQAKTYVNNSSNIEEARIYTAGKTPIYSLPDLPIILKQAGFQSGHKRLEEMKLAREICKKNAYKHIIIPGGRIHGEFIIETRLPLEIHDTKQQIGLYVENTERFKEAVKEFVGFLCQSTARDIIGGGTDSYKTLTDEHIPRYDNVVLYLERDQGNLAWVDLEEFSPECSTSDKAWCFHKCLTAISFFPYHLEEILEAAKKFDPDIEKYRTLLETKRDKMLEWFKIVYLDHKNFLKDKDISFENPAEFPEIASDVQERIKEFVKKKLEEINNSKLQSDKNGFGENFGDNLLTFEQNFPVILEGLSNYLSDLLKNRQWDSEISSYDGLVCFRTFEYLENFEEVNHPKITSILNEMKIERKHIKFLVNFIIKTIFERFMEEGVIASYHPNFGRHGQAVFL